LLVVSLGIAGAVVPVAGDIRPRELAGVDVAK